MFITAVCVIFNLKDAWLETPFSGISRFLRKQEIFKKQISKNNWHVLNTL